MSLLDDPKNLAEKVTDYRQPAEPKALVPKRKLRTYKFKDDGLIPNHPRWPFVIYESVVRLPDAPRFCRSRSSRIAGTGPAVTTGDSAKDV